MRRGVVLAGLLVAAGAAPLRAQGADALDPQCAGGALLMQDACQQAADLFRFLAPQLGGGQDRYDAGAIVNATAGGFSSGDVEMGQELTRTSYFADVYFNVLLAKIVAEVGMVQGGDVETYNRFDTPADDSRLYGSVGLRIGF